MAYGCDTLALWLYNKTGNARLELCRKQISPGSGHRNPHHPDGKQFALSSTNRASNGNGRRLDKEGNYVGNYSPVHVMQLPA